MKDPHDIRKAAIEDNMADGDPDYYGYHASLRTSIYISWASMKQRCGNKNTPTYERYGKRGIKVCERWETFEHFFADMHPKPTGTTLGRIDNNGNYCKENCRWETLSQQARNRRSSVFVDYNGQIRLAIDVADEIGISYKTMYARIYKGMKCPELFAKELPNTRKTPSGKQIEFHGIIQNIQDWADSLGLSRSKTYRRLASGWPLENVFKI